jgi:hypothetical protein
MALHANQQCNKGNQQSGVACEILWDRGTMVADDNNPQIVSCTLDRFVMYSDCNQHLQVDWGFLGRTWAYCLHETGQYTKLEELTKQWGTWEHHD